MAALLNRFGPRRLLELASEKDSGFTIRSFTEALDAIARLTTEDWADDDVHPATVIVALRALDDWRQRLPAGDGGRVATAVATGSSPRS